MAKTKQTGASARKAPAGNGEQVEKLTNKAEAVRRALAKLGNKAMPTEVIVHGSGETSVYYPRFV
jgi:hypothetical protein